MFGQFMKMNTASTSGSGSLPSNTVANPRSDLKAITTRSGVSYDGPLIPLPFSSLPKVVEWQPEVTKDTVQPSTEHIQPLVVQTHFQIDEPVVAPKPKPTIPYPLRANKQKLLEKYDNLALKFVEICRELHSSVVFADALLTLPIFAYSYNNSESVNRIDVIDVSCEEYAQEVLVSEFILEEIEACLTNDSIPPGIDDADFDPEGDLLLLEKLLNDDPSSLSPSERIFILRNLKR
ncbi:hypothetical protein Tco_1173996 [Tanacetum coccineum]